MKARIELNEARLLAMWPKSPIAEIREQLEAFLARADDERQPATERFHLARGNAEHGDAGSPVHTGLCDDLSVCLDHLFAQYVIVP